MDKKVVNRISEILDPTEEQRERMFSNILNEHNNETTKKRGIYSMRYFKHVLVASVLVVCLITTTAFAAVYMGLDINLLNFLKPSSKEQAEHLSNGAYVVDKQVQDKSGTLNIKQVIGDSNMTLILMDFIAPEGIALNKAHYSFEDINIDFDFDCDFEGYDIISLKDENIDDNKVNLIMSIKTNDSLAGQELHLKLTDLGSSDTWPGELTTVLSGEWETSFKLDFVNYSTDYKIDKEVKMYGYDASIKTISISPISIALKLKSSSAKEISKEAGNWKVLGENEYSDRYPVKINYKDGTSEMTSIFNGMTNISFISGDMLFIKTFESVINDKEIKSVTLFDTEINIAQ